MNCGKVLDEKIWSILNAPNCQSKFYRPPMVVQHSNRQHDDVKILFKITISTLDALFMKVDLKNFYLNIPMNRYEYLWFPINLTPQEIVDMYNLMSKVNNCFVMCEICRGIYGFPQAGILANKLPQARIAVQGCHPWKFILVLWKLDDWPLYFCLTIDNFGIKYVGVNHA